MVDMFVMLIPPAGGDELQVHNKRLEMLKHINRYFVAEGLEARYNGAQSPGSGKQSRWRLA